MSTSHMKVRGGPSEIHEFEDTKKSWNRHYTESFSIRKDVSELLLKLCKTPDLDSIDKLKKLLLKGNQDSTFLTIKNY